MRYLIFLLISLPAFADYHIQDNGEVQSFPAIRVADLPPETITYNYRVVPFENWNGIEKKILNLHPTYQPAKLNPVTVYVAKVNFVVKKRADSIDLQSFLDVRVIQTLDETIEQKTINPADVITYKETKWASRNPPAPARWCDGSNRTTCLKSHFTLPKQYQYAFAAYETAKGSPYKTLDGQSEIRIARGEEIENPADLRQLTGVSTAPAGVLAQNTFWFTHAIEYIKVLGIVQPVPGKDDESIVTGYMAFAIENKTWDMTPMGFPMRDLILGKAGNTKDGILSGLPKLTQHLALSLAGTFAR